MKALGFTLLEVVVATAILATALLGLITLQAQALHAQMRVEAVRELVSIAEAELDLRLALSGECSDCDCRTPGGPPSRVTSCLVEITSCVVSTDPLCAGTVADSAHLVEVTVESSLGQEFELRSIAADFSAP